MENKKPIDFKKTSIKELSSIISNSKVISKRRRKHRSSLSYLRSMSTFELSKVVLKMDLKPEIPSVFQGAKKRKLNIIKYLTEKGEVSLKRYCDETNLNPFSIYKYCKNNSIKLPEKMIPYGFDSRIDDLIPHGLTRAQIADKLGLSDSYISLYFQVTYLGKELDETLRYHKSFNYPKRLVNILNKISYKKAREAGWAQLKALELYRKLLKDSRHKEVSLETLIELFKRRKEAEVKREPRTYAELGRGLFKYPIRVLRLLKRSGVGPMYSRGKGKVPPKKF